MRWPTTILLAIFQVLNGFAQDRKTESFFETSSLKTSSFSVFALDAKTGEVIASTEQKSLSTASVMKLFTTAVALESLGPDFTFATSLYYSGSIQQQTGLLTGNLILKGGGDPAFYSSHFEEHYKGCFEEWIAELKTLGIKEITGQLVIDLSSMDKTSLPGGWAWDDIGNYYGAGVSALTYADNLYEIHLSSPDKAGLAVRILSVNPAIDGLKLDNGVVSSVKSGDNTIVFGAPGSYKQSIEGTIPVAREDFIVKASMPEPPVAAGRAFLNKLRENGILISANIELTHKEDLAKGILVGTKASPPLKDIIVPLNKESLNLYAEHLLREAGRKLSGDATVANGIDACIQFCKNRGIDSKGFFPADGSGLSRANAMTTKTLVETLLYVYNSGNREVFFNSLPIAGVDGTLKNSFRGTPLEKNVRAKTGSIARVRALAGMLTSRSGKTLLFAILVNNYETPSSEISKLFETILLSFYEDTH